jgi:hypothetical protein
MTRVRQVLTDEAWETMATILAEIKSKAGRPPEQRDRQCTEAVLYRARTGVSMVLTGGERHDRPAFEMVSDQVPSAHHLEDAVRDHGYDRHHSRERWQAAGIPPVMPPKSHRQEAITDDQEKYK